MAPPHRGEEPADRRRRHLGREDPYSQRARRDHVVAHRTPGIPPARPLDDPGDSPGDRGERQHHVVERQLGGAGTAKPASSRRGTARRRRSPPHEVPVQEQQVADLSHHHGRDGVVVAGEPEARPPHQQRGRRPHHAGREHAHRRRDARVHEQQCRDIGADAEIQRVPERDLPAIAAQNVPGLRQPGIQDGQDDQVLRVHVPDRQRQHRQDREHDRAHDQLGPPPPGDGVDHENSPSP